MQRWAIQLDQELLDRLTEEQLSLGDVVRDDGGAPLLLFRDRFVGLRVAYALGVPLRALEEAPEPVLA